MRSFNRLSVARVRQVVAEGKPGMFADGDGLYLSIARAGTASWTFRYMFCGKNHEMGLGPERDVTLKQARDLAYNARQLKRSGVDPLAAKREKRQAAAVVRVKTMTFQQCAKAYIQAHQAKWKNAQHLKQWVNSLEINVHPVIGALPVAAVDLGEVMKVLDPIWLTKTETASRVRGRIEMVLDWAKTRGFRSGENPARWRGHLQNLLPKRSKVAVVKHHPALPYQEIAAFMSDLRQHDDDQGIRALELMVLTATRTSEVLKATWGEFDLTEGVWTIPGERMKAGKEHRVPLSDAALAILRKQEAIQSNDYVFAGRGSNPAGKGTLALALKRLGGAVTAHGFRSTFADWATESRFAEPIIEMALAHTVAKVKGAYTRTDLFAMRRELMDTWARYCAGGAEVLEFPVAVPQSA
jgi:integrase